MDMAIVGVHHFSFSVTDLDRTLDFYTGILGAEIQSETHNSYETLGTALFGDKWGITQKHADLRIAVTRIGGYSIEFIQYIDPPTAPYHKDPSIAGASHIAFKVDDIEQERARLEAAGVQFHSPINVFKESGKHEWKWCYFRDPDGICLELVEQPDS
jgi:catechol 2,3-dioxygenase-like lactoylglutathione lyase family enzyme